MSWDQTALIQTIQEAERTIRLAEAHIRDQAAKINVLEEENTRLRLRLAKATDTIRRMEDGDL